MISEGYRNLYQSGGAPIKESHMTLKRLREEAAILQTHLATEDPDLRFILIHVESLLQDAKTLAAGITFSDSSLEEKEVVNRYRRASTPRGFPI